MQIRAFYALLDKAGDDKAGGGGADDKTIVDDKSAEFAKLNADLETERKERATLKKELDAIKADKLKEKEDYKTLFEQSEASKKEIQEKHDGLKSKVVYNEKYKAVSAKLLESGLKKEAMKILDKESLDDVKVEFTSEGRINVLGADLFAEKFKKDFAFAFEQKKAPNVNGGGGGSGGGGGNETSDDDLLTAENMFKLERSDKKKWTQLWPKYVEKTRAAKQKTS